MIFNTVVYYLCFLIPAAVLFRLVGPRLQPWICALFGGGFFVYFSMTVLGSRFGAACLLIFVWESLFSRLYKPGSWICFVGVAQALLVLVIFKYWNFFTSLAFGAPPQNPWFWEGAFLPLGVSFFTFEFIHYAVDRYRGSAPRGRIGENMAFILFFPTMVAGPIKRYQDFIPTLQAPESDWATSWHRGITRILVG